MLALHDKLSEVQKEEISQKEYIRGICDRNFNIEDTTLWKTSYTEVLTSWRGGDESVICDGVLYFLIYSTGGGTNWPKTRHRLIRFNLNNWYCPDSLMHLYSGAFLSYVGRLMNLKDKPVMVGGIGKHERSDIIKGIAMEQIDVIYILSYGSPALLMFDMNHRRGKWSRSAPLARSFPFTPNRFCFEPRLEVLP
ncbi:hypothetical protein IFM89_022344 [Coptis chinensis]|uniref:Uncharacterized protein n=1 Tax=Coptis chinensis TaxID=261450 RepID=A0A835LW37_9MAGN|nr:hypothetical protein IFM89_022344 [Coptis chinensis]